MISKKKIEVKPVRRSYNPKYPSYTDPNPLDHPESRPYPFTLKMMHSLSTAGFLGTVMFSCGVHNQENKAGNVEPLSQDTLINPFPMSATNLPYHPAMFGTGLASRLSSREVIDVLNLAFTSEGLNPVLDTTLNINGQKIPVSAYDPESKIGYIWMDYSNHGEGMIKSRYDGEREDRNSRKSIKKNLEASIDRLVVSYNENPAEFLKWQVKNDSYASEFKDKLDTNVPLKKSEKDRQEYLKREITEFELQSRINRVLENDRGNFSNIWDRSAIAHIGDKVELYITLNQIGSVSYLYSYEPSELEILKEAVARLDNEKTKQSWNKHSKALIDLLSVGSPSTIKRNPKYRALILNIVSTSNYTNWKARHNEILTLIDGEQISYNELKQIAENDDYHIAPISQRDDRSIYNPDYFQMSEEAIALQKQIRAETNALKKAEMQQQMGKLMEIRSARSEEIKAEAIRAQALKLQEDMKGYIRWAKSQIGY